MREEEVHETFVKDQKIVFRRKDMSLKLIV